MTKSSGSVTPMMAQFLEIKEDYPNAILFYRMGDFYEMFFDDAEAGAAALDIALTKRGKHLGKDIPMCGVPVHSAENYLLQLIRKGFRVAICEQLEDPSEAKKRGSKSVVKRGVTRLVTPGTLTEDSLLSPSQNNFLAAYAEIRGEGAFAWVDISTGEFISRPTKPVEFSPTLARIAPSEVIISETLSDRVEPLCDEQQIALTPLAPASFERRSAKERLQNHFSVSSLDGFGQFSDASLAAMGGLLDYLSITQKGKLPLLRPPVGEAENAVVQIDAATRRNLEITRTLSGDRNGSLLHAIDRTQTGAGSRLLEARINAPLTNIQQINARHEALSALKDDHQKRSAIQSKLKQVADLDRALTRLSLDRGGPRDMLSIRQSLVQMEPLSDLLSGQSGELSAIEAALKGHDDLLNLLDSALGDDVPMLARDGGFVKSGYRSDLDAARQLRDEGRQVIANMQANYANETGITALKVKHNNVLGYFIETPATHADKMLSEPLSETFIHRQTTANAVRFTTVELSELETNMLNATGTSLTIELEIYGELQGAILSASDALSRAAQALAELDIFAALAELAVSENYARPKLSNDRSFKISKGRHPVVEYALKKNGTHSFVPNDCDLSADQKPICLITGPNMAGKSTFLRQNALITILAQMGSFVPAEFAEIGIVDQIFSRVGASDDLARGRSTFMVEMVETAAILNQAGQNALVILDEIGRGTATYDGLSIAWAALEHLAEVNQCRALFATHYHELTSLADQSKVMENATVSVREWEGEIIFLHEVIKGAADRSYGIQVAKLAGLPPIVITRAQSVLDRLESGQQNDAPVINELPLFAEIQNETKAQPSKTDETLRSINPDELSAKAALDLIYKLKSDLD